MTTKSQQREVDDVTGIETTQHVWDGDIRELNKPLPKWWLYTFYACIVWAIGYMFVYPAVTADQRLYPRSARLQPAGDGRQRSAGGEGGATEVPRRNRLASRSAKSRRTPN